MHLHLRTLATLAVAAGLAAAPATASDVTATWWLKLQELCGQAFAGVPGEVPEDSVFENETLIVHVKSCTDRRVRVPFTAGGELWRIWEFNLTAEGAIELLHENRDETGMLDDPTGYGGVTVNPGSESTQVFPADRRTVGLIDWAYGTVWMVQISDDELVYATQNVPAGRRFELRFDLSEAVETPPAPPGWSD